LVNNDQDSAPWLVSLSQLGVRDVKDGADVMESVVEFLSTNYSHSSGSLLNFGGQVGSHCKSLCDWISESWFRKERKGLVLRLMQNENVEV
jgi:hypothetical protein